MSPPREEVCPDHNDYHIKNSPRKIIRGLEKNIAMKNDIIVEKDKTIEALRKKVKRLQRRYKRSNLKVTKIAKVIKTLRKKDLITSSIERKLNQKFSAVPLALIKRIFFQVTA